MKRILLFLFVASILTFIYAHFAKDKYPDSSLIDQQLYYEPTQSPTSLQPFNILKNNVTYEITPKYEYDLYGMVVSYHHSNDITDYSHDEWKDYINIKDICVLWGPNLENNIYKLIEFSSGNWTCFFQTKDRNTWETFDLNAISNNHILADNKEIAKIIMSVRRGDQVHISGYLVDYSNSKGGKRKTSTTRSDMGQGACEIVYVTDFDILKRGNALLNHLYIISKYLSLLFLAAYLFFVLYSARKSSLE